MRAPAVLLNVVFAAALGGIVGYRIALSRSMAEIAHLSQEQESSQIRERELRTQLQEAVAARAALVQETQQLQHDLAERLRRLEETAAKLAPPAASALPEGPP
jgi:type II secretory pathway predicted ATPase ExeA